MDLSNKTNDELKALLLEVCDKVVECSDVDANEIVSEYYCPLCFGTNSEYDLKLMEHDSDCVWKLCYDILYTH
jgi:hypothetical protein